MNNVQVADNVVKIFNEIKGRFKEKQYILISHAEADMFIKSLSRLAIIERHLSNICSFAYAKPDTKPTEPSPTTPAPAPINPKKDKAVNAQ